MSKICKDCKQEFTDKSPTQYQTRCKSCQIKLRQKWDLTKNIKKYKDATNVIRCKICGFASENDLIPHIILWHKMSIYDYYKEYNLTPDDVRSEKIQREASERVKGEKNNWYNHDGKYSSVSKNFIKYEDLTEEESKEKIEVVSEKISKGQRENGNNKRTLKYWLKQGFSEDEAREELSKYQITFSKEICIEKYGIKKGLEIWQKRQEKWLKNMPHNNFSKISQELFWKIYNKLPIKYQERCKFAELNEEKLFLNFKLDFFIEDLNYAIEFQGDYWHANPKKYKANRIINGKKAIEIWDKDFLRDEKLKENNINLTSIWESDYKFSKDDIIKQVISEISLLINQIPK